MVSYIFDHLTLDLKAAPLDELSVQLVQISYM
jgi:hypothetical protein